MHLFSLLNEKLFPLLIIAVKMFMIPLHRKNIEKPQIIHSSRMKMIAIKMHEQQKIKNK